MPVIDADGCPINVQVEGPEGAPVLMLSNSLGTTLAMWDGAGRAVHQALPPGALRPARPRQVRRAQGALHDGAARPRRAGGAGRARDQEDQLVRPLDGRHGRPVARRQCARTRRARWSSPTRRAISRTRRLERSPQARARKGRRGLRRRPTWSAGSPRDFCDARRRRSRRFQACSPPTPLEGYIACGEAVRDMDHRALLPKINAPTLVIAGRHDPATPLEANEYIKNQIPGAKLAVLDAAHISNVEQRDAYTAAVLGFLRS